MFDWTKALAVIRGGGKVRRAVWSVFDYVDATSLRAVTFADVVAEDWQEV